VADTEKSVNAGDQRIGVKKPKNPIQGELRKANKTGNAQSEKKNAEEGYDVIQEATKFYCEHARFAQSAQVSEHRRKAAKTHKNLECLARDRKKQLLTTSGWSFRYRQTDGALPLELSHELFGKSPILPQVLDQRLIHAFSGSARRHQLAARRAVERQVAWLNAKACYRSAWAD